MALPKQRCDRQWLSRGKPRAVGCLGQGQSDAGSLISRSVEFFVQRALSRPCLWQDPLSGCRRRAFGKAAEFIAGRDGIRISPFPYREGRDQADRAISKAQLHALLRFHMPPINVVVYHGSQARPGFEGGFPLRCFQRLSRPHIATRLCRWRDNRSTRGASIPVLSY